jgi:hypothetical protein
MVILWRMADAKERGEVLVSTYKNMCLSDFTELAREFLIENIGTKLVSMVLLASGPAC